MRRTAVTLIAALLLAGLLMPAVVVAKSENAAQTTAYTFEWPPDDPEIFCTGTRIVKTGPRAFVKDSEVCWDSTPPYEARVVIFDPTWVDPDGGVRNWYSDYDGKVATWAEWITTADGYWYITAYY